MKTRIKELIQTYYALLERERSKIRRAVLENVIVDLEQILIDAQ